MNAQADFLKRIQKMKEKASQCKECEYCNPACKLREEKNDD